MTVHKLDEGRRSAPTAATVSIACGWGRVSDGLLDGGRHGTITITPSIRLDTLRDSDIKIEISVWYINVVNFSPFLSYAMFGGAEHCHNCY